jgi:hypothetical protein
MLTMLHDGVVIVVAGIAVGTVAAWWLSRLLTGVVAEIPPAETAVVLGVAGLLSAAGLLAAYLPTRAATTISAFEALRHE